MQLFPDDVAANKRFAAIFWPDGRYTLPAKVLRNVRIHRQAGKYDVAPFSGRFPETRQ